MPKFNPKHKKTNSPEPKMGVKRESQICDLNNCSSKVKQHIAKTNYEKYAQELKWELKTRASKSRKIGLCKDHYKDYKKYQKKDDKLTKYRDFDGNNKPSRYKSNAFLE